MLQYLGTDPAFTLSNFDQVLDALMYATLYLQGVLLCCILYYYTLKLLKLTGHEHLRGCMMVPLVGLILAVTALQVLGVVEKSQSTEPRCAKCNFEVLLWFEFALTMLLAVLGIVLSVQLRLKIDRLSVLECQVPTNRVMFKRFWYASAAT